MPYSRTNPSPRYRELLVQYTQMHEEGDVKNNLPAEKTFPGFSLTKQVPAIKKLIDKTGARTLLDYGCGKGRQYEQPVQAGAQNFPGIAEYWGVQLTRYDPAYAPFTALPQGTFDGVICTDVLEHCPEEDVDWIVEGFFTYARRFVFATVACFPAKKTLPNGENAHCTVKSPEWWARRIQEISGRHPDILFEVLLMYMENVNGELKRSDICLTNSQEHAAKNAGAA